MDMLNPVKLDAVLAKSAQAIEDSWTTIGLQRGMSELVRLMSQDFESAFAASEDIKKLMQGVYNTFIEKFGFQKMTVPSLDLDPHRTKLKLLVHETEAFVKDPVNVIATEKHFLVKKFYRTLVNQARGIFGDARTQTERWIQAVTLPLEVQIKDHKAQLQSRLDSLAKINEKTTSINEQMAMLKSAEQDLKKQRDMIEGLIARVSQHEARASLEPETMPPPLAASEQHVPVELMQTTTLATFAAPKPAPAAAPAPATEKAAAAAPNPAAPLISDDLFAQLGQAPAFDPMKTQRLEPEVSRTQRLDPPPASRLPEGDKTQKIPALDPSYRPDVTQQMDAAPGTEATQRLDESILRLQEAKRRLQGTTPSKA